MSDVFISYAREDSGAAEALAHALEALGLSVFWDRSIPAGHSFEDVIEGAITTAKAVVVLWSCHSVRSDWVRAEAAEGARRGILVPATLDGEQLPLRYRIAQTADLADWAPALDSRTAAFSRFLDDIAGTVGRSPASSDTRQAVITVSEDNFKSIRQSLRASIGCAWIGSTALAVTVAYDFGVVTTAPRLWNVAYTLTLVSLFGGAVASVALGILSLRRRFVPGTLQGLVWPGVAAVGQLVILTLAARLFKSLPFMSEFEGLLAFVIASTLGPSGLTVGAVIVNRALDRKR